MATTLNPYLNFRDNAREAMEFYQRVFGGKVDMQTFKDFNASQDPADDDKIMHSRLDGENGVMFMAADTPSGMEVTAGSNIAMSLSGENETELRGYFDRLADGGMVLMPLEKAMWGDIFGMVVDRFGVRWLVNVSARQA